MPKHRTLTLSAEQRSNGVPLRFLQEHSGNKPGLFSRDGEGKDEKSPAEWRQAQMAGAEEKVGEGQEQGFHQARAFPKQLERGGETECERSERCAVGNAGGPAPCAKSPASAGCRRRCVRRAED